MNRSVFFVFFLFFFFWGGAVASERVGGGGASSSDLSDTSREWFVMYHNNIMLSLSSCMLKLIVLTMRYLMGEYNNFVH